MFSGFECLNLVKQQFDYFNGFRITMRKPAYPCKFGVHINTAIKEYEHFVGHLLDTSTTTGDANSQSNEWVEYELPLNLMVNNQIKSSLIHCHADDVFHMKGLSFHVEK